MEITIARWITRILNPLIMPSITILILMFSGAQFTASISLEGKWIIPLLIASTTFFLPSIFFIIMLRKGFIKEVEIPERQERILPILITGVFFYATYHMLSRTMIHPIFAWYMLSATLLVVLCLIITYFWKISIHMSAMGAMTGALIGISLLFSLPLIPWILLAVILSGFVGFARLRLEAHTQAQVYAGYLLGLIVFIGLFLIQG